MEELLPVLLAGFLASLVDGALGMGFGPTSATILLSTGLSPAATSATVNLAKVATGMAAAVSHWRFKNIDRHLVLQLAVPGALGAVIGAAVLASVDGDDLRPWLAVLLALVGLRILLRFSRHLPMAPDVPDREASPSFKVRGAEVAGLTGGVTNGLVGAWGPVVTPFLLHRGLPPRYAVGSVNTAEVAVAVTAAGSLITGVGGEGIELTVTLAMLAGGMIAAPLAAYVVRFFRPRLLGLAVAGLLLSTQSRELATAGWLPASRWLAYAVVAVAVVIAALRPPVRRARRRRAAQRAQRGHPPVRGASGAATSRDRPPAP